MQADETYRFKVFQRKSWGPICLIISLNLFDLYFVCGYAAPSVDVTELSIEELMDHKVSTVLKTEQTFSDTAAAVFIITQEDLRRSGVISIPEALRMVPGLEVAKIDSSKWAVTARGFNGRFANKLLVLIDGRSIYTPTFAGVFWENQDLLMDDIDRIEIVRGPGASVWGANAVNGIINIITKNAAVTQDELITVTAGNEERFIAETRFGGEIQDQAYYRIYAKHLERDGLSDIDGGNAGDDWCMTRGGFRLDWNPSSGNTVLLEGDVFDGNIDQNFIAPSLFSASGGERLQDNADTRGGNLLLRWENQESLGSRFAAQFFYDYFRRRDAFQNEK